MPIPFFNPKPAPKGMTPPQSYPQASANPISKLFFHWSTPILKIGYSRPLEKEDLWTIPEEMQCGVLADKIHAALSEPQPAATAKKGHDDPEASLPRAVFRAISSDVWWPLGWNVAAFSSRSYQPFMIRALIQRISGDAVGEMFALATSHMLILFVAGWFQAHAEVRGKIIGMQLRGAAIDLISRKSMKLSNKARLTMTDGRINTMITTDASYLDPVIWQTMEILSLVPQILGCVGVLIWFLGYSALVGIGVLLLSSPFQCYMFRRMYRFRDAQQKIVDQRVRITSEVIGSIQAIKLYAYERYFSAKISDKRQEELVELRKNALSRALTQVTMGFAPVLAAILTYITYALTDHALEAGTIFASLQIFNLLAYSVAFLPMMLSTVADAKLALLRIGDMLRADEQPFDDTFDPGANLAIDIDADFAYEAGVDEIRVNRPRGIRQRLAALGTTEEVKPPILEKEEQPFSLPGVKLEIPHGALVLIVGRVGVGKTALLSAMINALRKTRGDVSFGSKICYVPQHAWVQSGSIRHNITFSGGGDDDDSELQSVIDASALHQDIDKLLEGIDTEIGEKGITLSGGQKQRICIARAAYDPADIVLLDDPLSAVDPVVGRHLVQRCIMSGPFSHRTRILVTHQLDVLPLADMILVMDREGNEGRIVQQGTYVDLLAEEGLFRDLIRDYGSTISQAPKVDSMINREASEKVVGTRLELEEDRETGETGWWVYAAWCRAVGSWSRLAAIALAFISSEIAAVGTALWLGFWSRGYFPGLSQAQYMGIYGGLGLAIMICGFAATYGLAVSGMRASRQMFVQAWLGVMRAPSTWHDRTPSGRVISRITSDVAQLDDKLTPAYNDFILAFLGMMGSLGLTAYNYPWLCLAYVPAFIYVYVATSFYRKASREIKRTESLMRSQVYSSFAEQLAGVDVIDAFGRRDRFERDLRTAVDRQNNAHLASTLMFYWLITRLGAVGKIMGFLVMVFGILLRKSVDPARFGVTLIYALATVVHLHSLALYWAICEQEMTHVERVQHYTQLPREADALRPTDPTLHSWPTRGEITFREVEFRYRPDLPTVLNGLTFAVKGGEKIGIIGRTGAGKSSIVQALFRTVELCGGRIEIDGVDLSTLGLETLRSRLSIIPQDTFLFEGDVRTNIDPAGRRTDSDLNQALALIHSSNSASSSLKAKFRLDAEVHVGGVNFSAGERQLLALMRALASRTKVLIMDEATSSVDPETDALIQGIIQTEFADVTILCIAHRQQTVAYYDRVLVLDAGAVAELDHPLVLFDRADSTFRNLCDVKGISREEIEKIRVVSRS